MLDIIKRKLIGVALGLVGFIIWVGFMVFTFRTIVKVHGIKGLLAIVGVYIIFVMCNQISKKLLEE